MATFPKREPEVVRLIHDIASGFTTHKELFPNAPVTADDLHKATEAYYSKRDAEMAKTTASREGVGERKDAVKAMIELGKKAIHYAESLYRRDAGKLGLIGWGLRKAPTVTPDVVPGAASALVVQSEGKGWVALSWRDPVDGGTVQAYKIQRRKTGGDWADVGTAVTSETTLRNQETGVEFEYQVVAVNKTGEGLPSNIVRVVL
jgi:hypothetical protein